MNFNVLLINCCWTASLVGQIQNLSRGWFQRKSKGSHGFTPQKWTRLSGVQIGYLICFFFISNLISNPHNIPIIKILSHFMQLLLFVLPVLMFSHPFPGFLNRISCSPVFFLMISWPWHAMTLGIHGVPMAFSQVMSRAMPTETGALPVATGISRGGLQGDKIRLNL